jgi:hypothetical protein
MPDLVSCFDVLITGRSFFVLPIAYFTQQVIVTNLSGNITFCGGQIEQYLKHKTDDLLGTNVLNLVAPESRKAMLRLFRDLIPKEQQILPELESGSGSASRRDQVEGKGSNSNGSSDANVISLLSSDKSFPMLEVNVDATKEPSNAGDDVSDSSADNGGKRKHTGKGSGAATESFSLSHQFAESSSNENDANVESNPCKKVNIFEKNYSDERLS